MSNDRDEPLPKNHWSWVFNPWVLFLGGGVLIAGAAIGLLAWEIHSEQALVQRIRRESKVRVAQNDRVLWTYLPEFVQERVPVGWHVSRIEEEGINASESLSPSEFRLISQLRYIKRAGFSDLDGISDDDLLTFINRQPLKSLIVHQPRPFTVQQLEALAHKSELFYLSTVKGPFDAQKLSKLEQLQGLSHLQMTGPCEPNAAVKADAQWKRPLESVSWYDSDLMDADFVTLAKGKSLVELVLSKSRLTKSSWAALGSDLNYLSLESPHLDVELPRQLMSCLELVDLELMGSPITDEGVRLLCEHHTLQSLTLESSGLTVASAEILAAHQSLTSLRLLNATQVDDAWMRAFSKSHLLSLEIVDSQITDAGVAALQGNSRLDQLSLPGSRVTDRVFVSVTPLPFKFLDLSHCKITDEGIKLLEGVLESGGNSYNLTLIVHDTMVTKNTSNKLLKLIGISSHK